MHIRTILVDDETASRETISRHLRDGVPEVTVIAEAGSVQSAVEKIQSAKPQLLLLDISLKDGTGFDILHQLPEKDFEVIFITAYEKYAIEAFRFSAVDFLLKPVEPGTLREAVLKAIEKIELRQFKNRWEVLVHNLSVEKSVNKRLAIATNTGFEFLQINMIIRCESNSNYTVFHLPGGKKITTSRHLGFYEDLLPVGIFCRIHHSHLINLNYIERYIKGRGGSVIMKDGAELEVSQRRRDEFLGKIAGIQ